MASRAKGAPDPSASGVAAVLGRMASLRRELDALEHDVIELVRAHGATWDEIGSELGISRQAARQRFAKLRRRRR